MAAKFDFNPDLDHMIKTFKSTLKGTANYVMPEEHSTDIKPNCYLVDCSWVAYRAMHTHLNFHIEFGPQSPENAKAWAEYQLLSDSEKRAKGFMYPDNWYPTGVLYTFSDYIKTIRKNDPKAHILLVVDSMPEQKHDTVDDYKANRPSNRPDVHALIKFCVPYLTYLENVFMIYEKGTESDDHFFSFTRQYANLYNKFFIYANDRDIYQCINEQTFLYHKVEKGIPVIVDQSLCKEKWGVTPDALPMYKCIRGKTSDNIFPIMPRFPKKLACGICNNFKTPDEVLERIPAILKKVTNAQRKYVQAIADNEETIRDRYEISKAIVNGPLPLRYFRITPNEFRNFAEFFSINYLRSAYFNSRRG